MFTKTARAPQRERDRNTESKEEEEEEGGNEGNKDGIKLHLHSFAQAAPAERGDELVSEEEVRWK